jgi:catechol 2,3-dioxygenase-like lactoylglutathione lyase family enzyme
MRVMLRLHHVNLSIPVDGADAEAAFLVDYLNYERMELTPGTPPQAKWFAGEDGTQIHLSEDPNHHPSSRAHVAVDLGDSLNELRAKFDKSDYEYKTFDGGAGPTLFCQDPAGNRWELRGNLVD